MVYVKFLLTILVVVGLTEANYWYRGCDKCRRGPPSCNRWCSYTVIINEYCIQEKYVCCSYREKPGFCPSTVSWCPRPYPYFATHAYKCSNDYNCPTGYKCCRDDCYRHNVCKPIWFGNVATTKVPTTFFTSSYFTTPTSIISISVPRNTTSSASTVTTTTTPTTTKFSTDENTIGYSDATTFAKDAEISTSVPATTKSAEILTSTKSTINENSIDVDLEGSGLGIVNPDAELLEGFFDDEDFNH